MASNDNDSDAEYALSRLLQRGEAFALARVAEAHVQHLEETTFHKSNKVEETEARFEAIVEKKQNIKEKVDTTLSLPSEEALPVVKGPLDASEDTLLFLRSEDPNFKIQENGVKYVRALNVVLLEVVFTGPVDDVSSVIEDVFYIDESNVEGMHVREKFAEFFEDKGSTEKVLSATKLPKGGNSHSTYSSYHLEDKVNFEGVGNITPWAVKVRRRKRMKCYVQGSRRRKRKKISPSTSRKPYDLEEACIVWEGVLIDKKEESTSTDMPLGTSIHNIEITLGKGGQLARAAGAVAKLIAKEGKSATLKLPSGEVRLISKNCSATVGQVGTVGVNQKSLGRAGSKRWLGKRPVVKGVVMNPVDHPHGGGEGRAPIGRKKPTTQFGSSSP
ncbi:ribosomal protein L2 [Tanacetum coccineum]